MPEVLLFLCVPEGMGAVYGVEVFGETGNLLLQRQRIRVRVGDQQHFLSGFAHGLEEPLCAGQVLDAVVMLLMQLQDVKPETLAPVIEAIPVKFTLHVAVLGQQAFASFVQGHAVPLGPLFGDTRQPHVIVVGKIEDRAIHVEHERIALA